MKRFSSALILGAAALTIVSSGACGDDSEATSSSGGGSGGGTPSTSSSTSTSSTTSVSTSTSSSDGGGTSTSSSSSNGGGGSTSTTSSSGSGGEGGTVLPGNYDCTGPTGEVPALTLTPVFSVPGVPLQLKQAPGDTDRFFVATKGGVIYVVVGGVVLDTPFLDISDRVYDDSESGLLGLAFHPDYQENGRFFINYNSQPDGGGETYVAEYTASGDPNVANPVEVGRIIQAPAFFGNHNGGSVEVGPDGQLYVSVGDGGAQGDPNCRAQDLDNRGGKILRADISTPGSYSGSDGNYPGADEYVFDIGFRNPWRMSFDVCTGNLWIADVGQDSWEEVSVHPDGAGPSNFQWNNIEGRHTFDCAPYGCPGECAFAGGDEIEAILDYEHGVDGNSITGGYVYRSSAIPALRGAYIFGDYGTGNVWMTRYAPGDAMPVEKTKLDGLQMPSGRLVAMGQDNNGNVYLLNAEGQVSRVDAQ